MGLGCRLFFRVCLASLYFWFSPSFLRYVYFRLSCISFPSSLHVHLCFWLLLLPPITGACDYYTPISLLSVITTLCYYYFLLLLFLAITTVSFTVSSCVTSSVLFRSSSYYHCYISFPTCFSGPWLGGWDGPGTLFSRSSDPFAILSAFCLYFLLSLFIIYFFPLIFFPAWRPASGVWLLLLWSLNLSFL